MNTFLLMEVQSSVNNSGYAIGAFIALFILGYLIYALIKPEKF
jgi:K+-transporting ATPase KdpF subunit